MVLHVIFQCCVQNQLQHLFVVAVPTTRPASSKFLSPSPGYLRRAQLLGSRVVRLWHVLPKPTFHQMKASPSRHGYQKVPQHDPHISEVETDCDSLWHTERFNMSPENGISVDLLKIEKDDEDDDLISAVDKKSMFYFVESWWCGCY